MKTTTPHITPIRDRVEIRPLADTDRAGLAEEFSHLSAQTRRRRFGGTADRLTERDLDRLTNVDHHNHEALAAIDPDTDQIVGVARYIALPNDPGVAEVAIELDDEWQRRGIGRKLISKLLDRAREEGIVRFVAYVSNDNQPVRGWIVRSGGIVQTYTGDATIYTIPIAGFAEARRAA
ncbi:MAG: N-acetyltransferase family protein [Solirubrobacteraceae bacterium]